MKRLKEGFAKSTLSTTSERKRDALVFITVYLSCNCKLAQAKGLKNY